MKKVTTLFILLWINIGALHSQHKIKGTVVDENNYSLPNVNLFIKETLEGASSNDNGEFVIDTEAKGIVTFCAMMLGYETWILTTEVTKLTNLTIKMHPSNVELDGVEIVASNFVLKGSSQWSKMDAVDLVTGGGSNGDLYRAITNMPGTQIAGENGRLFIRGGESREAQTYIDDMHVLFPYTSTGAENTPVHNRYSPFMFDGISFSLGGYDPEYGQGLSSVLPLTTKNESPISKYGVNFSSVGASTGGTKSFEDGSASMSIDYQNLAPYYALIPDRTDWKRPYQKASGSAQFRYHPNNKTVTKLFVAHDYTSLAFQEDERKTDLKEHNLYLNGTIHHQTKNGYKLFGGAAFSWLNSDISGAEAVDDLYRNKEWELHLKMKAEKRYNSFFKLQLGTESMVRGIDQKYDLNFSYKGELEHSINSMFTLAHFNLSEKLSASFSSRLEYTSTNKQWNYLPRIALNYNLKDFYVSAIAGRYSQLTYNDYLLRKKDLSTEICWHYILGGYHQSNGRIYRLETYYKDYDRLSCETEGGLNSFGYGYSKGVDLFFNDASLTKNLEYRLSYSLNYAKRKYRDYPVKDVPQYATKHNASLSLRYTVNSLKSIVGLTNRYASGRPYHNPNKPGFMNSTAPVYNSLDLSWTFLANKKLIVFASATNLLARKQVYNYKWSDTPDKNGHYQGSPVHGSADQFFYIGVFITLGGNSAYDVSNF